MSYIRKLLLTLALILSAASTTFAQGLPLTAERALLDPAHREKIEAFLTKIHEPDSRKLVVMTDGTIYSVRAPRTGRAIGVVNLWHCYGYHPVGESNIHTILNARVVGEVSSEDFAQTAARYDMQCMDQKANEWLVRTTRIVVIITFGALF